MRTIPTRSQPTNPTEMIFSKLIWYSLSDVQTLPVWPLDIHKSKGHAAAVRVRPSPYRGAVKASFRVNAMRQLFQKRADYNLLVKVIHYICEITNCF
jgi:hypothetical protein